jgi:hypothetical protein
MSEETNALDFFSAIPSDYGGTATMEPPARESLKPPASEPLKADSSMTDAPKATPGTSPEDLLAPVKEGAEKPAKQYAQERREAKERKRELLEKAPVLEEENAKLKADYEAAQRRLQELEVLTGKEREDQAITKEDIETLRTRAESAEKRYIAAHGPDFDPYQDEEVVRHARLVEDALKANLPKLSRKADGTSARINLEILRKEPQRKNAMDTAVAQYAMALESGDERGLDKAVMLMSTALGGLDIEDDDVRVQVETALSSAAEPFVKGLQRFRHVQENSVSYSRQRRAEQIQATEARLLQPLRFDAEAVDAALEKEPGHPWANFGKLVNELPDEVRETVVKELRQDALVVGAMRYTPPPLPSTATAQELGEHEAIVRASEERAARAAQYLAVGRAMIDGGLLAHMRAQVAEMKERLEDEAGSTTLPRPNGGGGEKKASGSANTIWDAIPSSYKKT